MENKTNKIYKKIAKIQGEIKELEKDAENKFQKYFYFTEAGAIKLLKPKLEKEGLALTFSDSEQFFYEKQDKEHVLRYLKKVIIGDGENEELIFNLWAMGQDADIAKARGKAETYTIKYFLSKFFMIPIVDELDPDQPTKKEENIATHNLKADGTNETASEVLERHKSKELNEIVKKYGLNYKDSEEFKKWQERYKNYGNKQ